MKKIVTEMSADSRALYERLGRCKVGDVLSYEEMERLTRRDLRNGERYVLYSALRQSLRDGRAFGCIRGIGVKFLTDGEIVADADGVAPRIRRLSRRASRKLAAVRDFDKLPNDQKIRHNTLMSLFGAITAFGRESSIAKIETEVKRTSQKLSLAATLEAFSDV